MGAEESPIQNTLNIYEIIQPTSNAIMIICNLYYSVLSSQLYYYIDLLVVVVCETGGGVS